MRMRLGKPAVFALPIAAAAGALAMVLHHGAASVRPDPPPPPPPARAVRNAPWYLGVREPTAPRSWAQVAAFGRASGTQPDIVLYYSGWRQPFQTASAREAYRHHAALLVQMEPWGANLSLLARGGYDGYLRSFASQVREFGHQVIIGFGHEMNGPWYPWGPGHVSPATFVAAWRHVVTVFRAAGADNVTWLWTVHHTSDAAQLRAYWPGNHFVTWVGIDGYYEFPDSTFSRIFGRSARAVRTFADKPILISETAVGPGAGDVPAKIRSLFAGVRRDHFLGLVWFDVAQYDPPFHQNWRLEGKPAALAAFREEARQFSGQGRLRG